MIISNHNILKIALFLGAFFLVSISFAQRDFELLPGSSEMVYDENLGVKKLLGGANFKYQGNTMYCDSAYMFDNTNFVRAYGHVHIQKTDNVNLFCDSLQYNPKNGMAKLWGHVRAIDTQYKLTTDSMDFDTRTQQGTYHYGGKIENQLNKEVLTSRVGYFYPNSQNFFFRGNVKYTSETLNMTTDTLQYKYSESKCYFFGPTEILTEDAIINCESGWYNVKTEEGQLIKKASIQQESKLIKADTLNHKPKLKVSEGFGNVFFHDTLEQIAFQGEYALINDSLNYSLLTKNALATKFSKKDTVYIHADTLFNQNDILGNRLLTKGFHNVRIFSSTAQAISDSLIYSKDEENMELYKNPIVWSRNVEMKGDSIRLHMNDSVIYKASIIDHATIIMEVDSIQKYYNQIGGNEINAYFKDNEVYRVLTEGNAQTILFPTDEEKSDTLITVKRLGMNRLYASELKIYLDSGEVTGITYYQNPDGVFYPMDQIKESEKFIANFKLNFGLRPKSVADLLNSESLEILPEEEIVPRIETEVE